jgi:hypothetical protein
MMLALMVDGGCAAFDSTTNNWILESQVENPITGAGI